MPIYRYRCGVCDATTEVWGKMDDPPPDACPSCGATGQMTQAVTRTAFQLKGGGWYAQGYGGGAGGGAAAAGGEGGGDKPADAGAKPSDSSTKPADTSTTPKDAGPKPPAASPAGGGDSKAAAPN